MQLRRFLGPKWIAGHLFVVAAAVTMVFLGRWQLDVSNSKHFDLQNFGYALQWWAFSIFTLVMWVKIMRDVVRREDDPSADSIAANRTPGPTEAPRAYRSYSMPQSASAPQVAGDSEHAAYNAYLSQLAQGDQ